MTNIKEIQTRVLHGDRQHAQRTLQTVGPLRSSGRGARERNEHVVGRMILRWPIPSRDPVTFVRFAEG